MVSGNLKKMRSSLIQNNGGLVDNSNVEYFLPLGDSEVPLNPYIGKHLTLKFLGDIHCSHCNRRTNKSFSQGFCFPCMKKLACCDMCIY